MLDQRTSRELRRKSDEILRLKKSEQDSELFKEMENNNSESMAQISLLKDELRQKTNEVLKFMQECRTLRDRMDMMEKEKSVVFGEKEELVTECDNLRKKVLSLQEEKSNLTNMIRDNVDDLSAR